MDMYSLRRNQLILLIFILVIASKCGSKRGGISIGRGSSPSRTGIFRSPNRGGVFGGSRTGGASSGGGWNRGRIPTGRTGGGFGGGSRGSQFGKSRSSLFTKSNIGSFVAGAAAGYLTYKAGKALIRSAYSPMMWHNRPYYWGSNYYRGGYGTQMCRMPVDPSDGQLNNVYFEDGVTRPKELVWSCNRDEYCCGYDCCWRGGGSSSFWGLGLGF